jgi:hypothetical protein
LFVPATGFIIPEIMVRRPKADSLNELHAQRIVPFTYFFNQKHFKTTLGAACPRMHIYDHQNDLWDVPSTASPVRLLHPHLATPFHMQAETMMLNPSNWTNAFNDHLNTSHPAKFSEVKPVLVSLHKPLLQWPINYDQPPFIACFGRILRLNEDVRRLAAKILYAMDEEFQLGMNPQIPGIQEGKFYGAHLRTAIDAVRAGWTPYENQSDNYLLHAASSQLRLIYAASDSPPDLLQFTDDAANYTIPMNVTTKELLLVGQSYARERAEMAELTLDQQSLVDYEVLMRASKVGGTWESSFSWNLAMRRHIVVGQGSWIPIVSNELSVWEFSPKNEPGIKTSNSKPSIGATDTLEDLSPTTSLTEPVAKAGISNVSLGNQKPTMVSEVDWIDLEENPGAGTNSEGEVPPGKGQLSPEKGEMHLETGELTPEKGHLTPEKGGLTPENGNLIPEKGNLTLEKGTATSEKGDVTTEVEDVTLEKGGLTQEEGKVTPEKGEVTLEKRAVSEMASNPSIRQLPADLYSFSDAYSTVFGVMAPGDHPGIVFQLALWP